MGLADSKHFLRFVHAMATDPDASVRELSEETSTPLATAHRIARFFRFHRAMPRDRFDVRRGLRLAADVRRDRAVPDRTFKTDDLYDLLHAIDRVDHHLAFASAANAIAHFEPVDTHVRIDNSEQTILADLKTFHSASGKHVVHVYLDDLSRYPDPIDIEDYDGAATAGPMPVCDPIVTLIDLLSHPTGGAHAEFLDRTLTLAGTLPERPS